MVKTVKSQSILPPVQLKASPFVLRGGSGGSGGGEVSDVVLCVVVVVALDEQCPEFWRKIPSGNLT